MSDVHAAAPGDGAAPAAPVVTPAIEAPQETTPITAREAAQNLAKARWAKHKAPETPAPSSAPEAAPEPQELAPQGDNADPPQEAPGETQQPDPAELPSIEAPRSWTKDEQERFKTYPRELQAYLSEREQERDRDLRRRQNEAADLQKATKAEQEQAAKARQEYEAALPQLLQTIQHQVAGEFADVRSQADVARMAAEDPARYIRWDAAQKQLQAVHQEMSQADQRRQQESSDQWKQYSTKEDAAFAEKVPDIADKEKGPKLRESAVTVLRDLGFTEQELASSWNGERGVSLRDHRLQLLILDAVKFREAKAKAATPLPKPVPTVQRPGVAQPRTTGAEATIKALDTKLEQTGSAKDAAALISARRAARR